MPTDLDPVARAALVRLLRLLKSSNVGSKSYRPTEVRKLGPTGRRVETGAVQFGSDWPGVFLRGDDAFALAMHLRDLIGGGESVTETRPFGRNGLAKRLDDGTVVVFGHKDLIGGGDE